MSQPNPMTVSPERRARSQAMAQRRNLLNIERELLADAANIQRHAANIRKAIDEIEKEYSFESTGPCVVLGQPNFTKEQIQRIIAEGVREI